MSMRTIHFQTIRSNRRRPLCNRAGIVCSDSNSSTLRNEVTCKMCLKRMMATATFAAECKAIAAEIEREIA